MDNAEFDKIVFKVTEDVLLRIPDVMGNLIKSHIENIEINKRFYTKNPEFKANPEIVRHIVEQKEKEDISLNYEEILDNARPLIKQRIKQLTVCDIETKPDLLSLSYEFKVNSDTSSNGAI